MTEQIIANLVKIGVVSSVNEADATCRVMFDASDKMVSHDLRVLHTATHQNKSYSLPDVGSQVVCVFLPNGLENGFVLGSFYSDADECPVSSIDKYHRVFKDGSVIEYDRAEHKLTASINGSAEIKCDSLVVDCPENTFKGKVTIEDGLEVSGGGESAVKINGKMQATDVTTDKNINLDDHIHHIDSDYTGVAE